MNQVVNQFAIAFLELLAANDACCGTPQFVLIGGKKKRAIISEIGFEEIMVLGGNTDLGGFQCQCAASEFAEAPAKGTAIKKPKGQEFEILSVKSINGAVFEITAGDPAAQENDNG